MEGRFTSAARKTTPSAEAIAAAEAAPPIVQEPPQAPSIAAVALPIAHPAPPAVAPPAGRRKEPTYATSAKHPELNGVFGKFLADGTPYLSPSQIKKVMRCAADWKFQYLDGHAFRTNTGIELGTICHDAFLENGVAEWLHSGAILKAEELAAIAEKNALARFQDRALLDQIKDPENANAVLLAAQAKGLLMVAWPWFLATGLTPIAFERPSIRRFTIPHPKTGKPLEVASFGYFDLMAKTQDGRIILLDLKHVARAPDRDMEATKEALTKANGVEPDERFLKDYKGELAVYSPDMDYFHQLLNYADAEIEAGQRVDEVWAVYVVKTKVPKVIPVALKVGATNLAWSRHVSATAFTTVATGNLGPNPFGADWRCSDCDHKDRCPATALILERSRA